MDILDAHVSDSVACSVGEAGDLEEDLRLDARAQKETPSRRLNNHTDLIMSDPKAAIEQLRKLHDARGIPSDNGELYDFMEALADFACPCTHPATLQTDHPVTKELLDNGLMTLIRDVVADALFEEDLSYVGAVLNVVVLLLVIVNDERASLGLQAQEVSSGPLQQTNIMDEIISHVLQSAWTARHLLEFEVTNEPQGLVRGVLLLFLPLIYVIRLSDADCVNLRNLAGFLWLTLDERIDHLGGIDSNKAFMTALLTFSSRGRGRNGWLSVEPFVQNDLCDVYGDRRVLERLTSTFLQYKSLNTYQRRALLYWTPMLLDMPRFYPHFKSTGILAAVRAACDERMEEAEREGNPRLEMEAVVPVAWAACHLAQHAPFQDGAVLLVKHCDILELIARFVVLHVDDSCDVPDLHGMPPRQVVDVFAKIAGALHLRSGRNELRRRFKLALRREWYPTLKTLQGAGVAPQRGELLDAWKLLGDAMDLDEERERLDYERESKRAADRRCSWRECDYHTKKPPRTRACVGCDEARYCSRACQRKDWREGGHRARCRRLRDVPKSFIDLQEREERNAASTESLRARCQRRGICCPPHTDSASGTS